MEENTQTSFPREISNRVDCHFLVLTFPLKGHFIPMMKLSVCIASHGVKVTLIMTEDICRRMVNGSKVIPVEGKQPVRIVAVPDGLEQEDDRKDQAKLAASVFRFMAGQVYDLIAKTNQKSGNDSRITCLVADTLYRWAPDVAEKIGVKLALFWPTSPGVLVSLMRIPELKQSSVIDQEGTALKEDEIDLLQDMPSMNTRELPWCCTHKKDLPKSAVFNMFSATEQVIKHATWLLCNWFHELSPSASIFIPNLVPVGPLIANAQPRGMPDPKDSTCLTWLDQQPSRSVIYVAFGTMSTFSQNQLDELASGLELSGRRFLWVVRADFAAGNSQVRFPDGFEERISGIGMVVEWASQEVVLAHPSIACFLTHCGWNSMMEGLCNGVPLLCWPCFGDQLYTRTCICDAWKVGLNLVPEENNGIISANEVKFKINELLSRTDLLENSSNFKEIAKKSVAEGGSSFAAMRGFIEQTRT